jgi:hypothetical protein
MLQVELAHDVCLRGGVELESSTSEIGQPLRDSIERR